MTDKQLGKEVIKVLTSKGPPAARTAAMWAALPGSMTGTLAFDLRKRRVSQLREDGKQE